MLKATAASVLTFASGFGGEAHAQAKGSLKSTHGSGFCNLNCSWRNALQMAKEDGLEIEFIITPTFAEQVTFLGMGQVDRA